MEGYGIGKKTLLGIQHTFTMFGATVLVPIITGFDINVALFMAGAGTLLFHVLTKMKVPAYLGSSFAFITPVLTVATLYNGDIAYASGGLVIAGLIYVFMSLLIGIFGIDRVLKFFPPIVTGPIIILIGLGLAPTAIKMASSNYLLAFISFVLVAGFSVYAKGFFKVIPVLTGLVLSYIVAILMGTVDFTEFTKASLLGMPRFTTAKFSTDAIFIIAPVALV
ncbi:MAG: solute carrier family 23 protein, partial [Peptostreptococcales bacterium]